jgi:predicted GNAT family acetyltransferase
VRTRFAGFSGHDVLILRDFLGRDELLNLPAISRLEQYGPRDFMGWFVGDQLRSVFQVGASLMPIGTTEQARSDFVDLIGSQGRRCASIVGIRHEVAALWNLLEPKWGPARALRDRQYFLSLQRANAYAIGLPELEVRVATLADFEQLLPASIDMFTAELGVSPIQDGGDLAYRTRLASQIEGAQIFVGMHHEQLVFKCEVGASSATAALLQGVWVANSLRNRGIASAALSEVIQQLFRIGHDSVCLYVNDFNAPALATYAKLGFRSEADYMTVLF